MIKFDELTCYPGVECSNRRNAGDPRKRLGYECTCVTSELAGSLDVTAEYEDEIA